MTMMVVVVVVLLLKMMMNDILEISRKARNQKEMDYEQIHWCNGRILKCFNKAEYNFYKQINLQHHAGEASQWQV